MAPRLILLFTLLLASCGTITTEFTSPLFMPLVSKGPEIRTSPKKGVSLGIASCEALDTLGVSWYYSGKECEGHERVLYLDKPHLLAEAISKPPPDAKYVMFLNECDLPRWDCPSIEEQVRMFVSLENAWPAIIYVGPCIAGDVRYLQQWWEEYEKQTGHPPDPQRHRLCSHCYSTAQRCIWQTGYVLQMPLDRVWVTEFGLPLGLNRTVNGVMTENQLLVDWMESEDRVERFAYWGAKFHYGDTVPAKPVTGWYPLVFDWYGDTVTEIPTDMGEWYMGVGK